MFPVPVVVSKLKRSTRGVIPTLRGHLIGIYIRLECRDYDPTICRKGNNVKVI